MKIIKYGCKIEEWRKKLTCFNCLSVLELEVADLIPNKYDINFTVECAACNGKFAMFTSEIPELVVHAARKNNK